MALLSNLKKDIFRIFPGPGIIILTIIDGSCDNNDNNIECLDKLANDYNLVIIKHCYPGAGILSDLGAPEVSSDRKSLENYKAQYRALRTLMGSFPSTKFMVWTLTPLHRLETDAGQASRAKQFVDWVKNTWLTEDGNEHPNIIVFDFFSLVAEQNPSPADGQQYCLKYGYERSHTDGSDLHPNRAANEYVGPIFAQAVLDALLNSVVIHVESIQITGEGDANAISTPGGTLQLTTDILPVNATNHSIGWSVVNSTGQSTVDANGLITAVSNGTVTAIASAFDGSGITDSFPITITGQAPVSVIEMKTNYKISINQNNLIIDQDQSNVIDQVRIYNTCGAAVVDRSLNSTQGIIDLSGMVPADYFVQLISKNTVEVVKIFKP